MPNGNRYMSEIVRGDENGTITTLFQIFYRWGHNLRRRGPVLSSRPNVCIYFVQTYWI